MRQPIYSVQLRLHLISYHLTGDSDRVPCQHIKLTRRHSKIRKSLNHQLIVMRSHHTAGVTQENSTTQIAETATGAVRQMNKSSEVANHVGRSREVAGPSHQIVTSQLGQTHQEQQLLSKHGTVPDELKNLQQANAQLNAVSTNCSLAQSPLGQAEHVKLSQQTVRQPYDSLPLWWRHVQQNLPLVFLAQAPHEARLAGLRVNLTGQDILSLLDAVAPVPNPLILGLDWLRRLRAVWHFGYDRITVFRGSGRFNLSMAEVTASDLQGRLGQAGTDTVRAEGKAAQADLMKSLNQLGPQASALVPLAHV
ncbi:hypothetical protein Esti_005914 [Eimeria stiedai]